MEKRLEKMLEMQKTLNEDILAKHGKSKYNLNNLNLVLLDEVGELVHELKGDWCWWKCTQKEPDIAKVKEEFVDCIHFGLCLILEYKEGGFGTFNYDAMLNNYHYVKDMRPDLYEVIENALSLYYSINYRIANLFYLGERLGFSFNEIYEAYVEKNKINFKRLKEGY